MKNKRLYRKRPVAKVVPAQTQKHSEILNGKAKEHQAQLNTFSGDDFKSKLKHKTVTENAPGRYCCCFTPFFI